MPQIKQLNIRCAHCRLEREKAGIVDPPLTDAELQEYMGYWQKQAAENEND